MTARLLISEGSYTLLLAQDGVWRELAVLPGGGRALLPASRPVSEASLEMAIEVAEDWLMPHAPGLHAESLAVEDATGRLASGLQDILCVTSRTWGLKDVEHLFLELVGLVTGRSPPPSLHGRELFVSDVLLLRELAHHAQLREIRLE